MAWVKVDDKFYVHENRWEIGLEGMGLYLVMLCYCNDKLTDGFVSDAFIEANMPRPDRRGTVKKIIATGMAVRVEGGIQLINYHKFQPARADVLGRRQKRSVAGKRGADARWGKPDPHGKSDAEEAA